MRDAEDQRLRQDAEARPEKTAKEELFAQAREQRDDDDARHREIARDRAQVGMQLLGEAESLHRDTRR